MKHIGALVLAALLAPLTLLPAVTVEDLRCEYRENPLGIDVVKPRFGWRLEDGGQRSEVRWQRQTAYQVLVASSDELLKGTPGDLWDSGKVVSDQSIQVEYAGKPLKSRLACCWRVRVWDKDGKASAWSKPATFETWLLEPDAWQAKWIGMSGPEGKRGSPLLGKEVEITGKVKRARVYVSGLGWSELYLKTWRTSLNILGSRSCSTCFFRRSRKRRQSLRLISKPWAGTCGSSNRAEGNDWRALFELP